jgi:hypothetical protein
MKFLQFFFCGFATLHRVPNVFALVVPLFFCALGTTGFAETPFAGAAFVCAPAGELPL